MKRHGTTLVELMVTVAIIGVMSSLSIYGFGRLTRIQRQVGGMREVAMLLGEARAEARARNQPVRVEVLAAPAGTRVRWGRLPCGDPWGRACPSSACTSTASCGGGCVCDQMSGDVTLPPGVTVTGLNVCFLGSTGAPRGPSCQQGAAAVTTVRFDLAEETAPYLLTIEPLSGVSRLVDCGRAPKDPACP